MTQFDQRWQQVRDQYNAARDINIVLTDPKVSPTARRNRQAMIDRVGQIWVKGFLERSLAKATQFVLGFREQPQEIVNPWGTLFPDLVQASGPLPEGTPILQVYDNAGEALLILGEPGAGKTTLLLELLRDLLARAHTDETHPIPVIFHLASWTQKQQPFTRWLIEELFMKYRIPRRLGQQWVENDQIIVLLDSLDFVQASQRAACIEAINMYRQEHFLVPVVVCCRWGEYQQMKNQLQLQQAVLVQPLDTQQIDTYLMQAGSPAAGIRMAFHQNTRLQQIARTPLMLNMLALAYHDKSIDDLATLQMSSPEMMSQQILETYIRSMFERRSARMHYKPEQVTRWLSWLARQLTRQNQAIVSIERLQPEWLPRKAVRLVYYGFVTLIVGLLLGWAGWLGGALSGLLTGTILIILLLLDLTRQAVRRRPEANMAPSWKPFFGRNILLGLLQVIMGGLPFGIVVGSVAWFFNNLDEQNRLKYALFLGAAFWLFATIVFALIMGVVGQRERPLVKILHKDWKPLWRDLLIEWIITLLCGLPCGFTVWFILVKNIHQGKGLLPANILLFSGASILLGIIGGLFLELFSVVVADAIGWKKNIEPAEAIIWSWKRFWKGLVTSFIFRTFIGLVAGILFGLFFSSIIITLLLLYISPPTPLLIQGMPYRFLCNNMWREYVKPRPDVASRLFCYAPLHNICYGIIQGPGQGFLQIIFVLLLTLIINLIIYLFFFLFIAILGVVIMISSGVFFGLTTGLIGLLSAGLSSTMLDPKYFTTANQGIRRSFRNSLVFGVLGSLVLGGIGVLIIFVSTRTTIPTGKGNVALDLIRIAKDILEVFGPRLGIIFALLAGPILWLRFGGLACIQHFNLRYLLWQTRALPWNLPRFLDEATECMFLSKVGGNYIFTHRLFLDYFASRYQTPPSDP